MAGSGGVVTKASALTHLQEWLDAESAVSLGQAYTIAGRSLTRADADTITTKINHWRRVVQEFEATALGAANPNIRIAVATRAR